MTTKNDFRLECSIIEEQRGLAKLSGSKKVCSSPVHRRVLQSQFEGNYIISQEFGLSG